MRCSITYMATSKYNSEAWEEFERPLNSEVTLEIMNIKNKITSIFSLSWKRGLPLKLSVAFFFVIWCVYVLLKSIKQTLKDLFK